MARLFVSEIAGLQKGIREGNWPAPNLLSNQFRSQASRNHWAQSVLISRKGATFVLMKQYGEGLVIGVKQYDCPSFRDYSDWRKNRH